VHREQLPQIHKCLLASCIARCGKDVVEHVFDQVVLPLEELHDVIGRLYKRFNYGKTSIESGLGADGLCAKPVPIHGCRLETFDTTASDHGYDVQPVGCAHDTTSWPRPEPHVFVAAFGRAGEGIGVDTSGFGFRPVERLPIPRSRSLHRHRSLRAA
jgi:hypothetical protein